MKMDHDQAKKNSNSTFELASSFSKTSKVSMILQYHGTFFAKNRCLSGECSSGKNRQGQSII